MEPPKTIHDVRSFLGATGYYRQCIPNYAHIAEPLTDLLKIDKDTPEKDKIKYNKKKKVNLNKKHMDSFNELKEMLISSKIMAHPTTDKPFKLYTDACDYCIGAVLVQDDEEGIEKVVQYVSHKLGGAQLKWATIEKEGYAVIYTLQKLRHYLTALNFKFSQFINHY